MKRVCLLLFLVVFGKLGSDSLAQEFAPPESGGREFFRKFFQSEKGSQKLGTDTWEIFAPGKLPPGKILTERVAAKLETGDYSKQTLYLIGNFTVTASGVGQAILRPSPEGYAGSRIIVEYPSLIMPPDQGSILTRGEGRGFLITRVERSPKQHVNLWVREITESN